MNAEQFENAVNLFYQPLYVFALGLSRSPADASDLTQEAFQHLAIHQSTVREPGKIKTWLFTTLYRAFLADRRQQDRLQSIEITELETEAGGDESAGPDRVDATAARKAMFELDEVFRVPLVLFYLEQHSYQEIASILDLPLGTVMSRIARGKNVLRARLVPVGTPGSEARAMERIPS